MTNPFAHRLLYGTRTRRHPSRHEGRRRARRFIGIAAPSSSPTSEPSGVGAEVWPGSQEPQARRGGPPHPAVAPTHSKEPHNDVFSSGRLWPPDLERAFNEYAEAHGHDLAVEALERSTGARDLASVPEHRIVNALTELICGFSFVGQRKIAGASCEEHLSSIHAELANIGQETFARLHDKAAR